MAEVYRCIQHGSHGFERPMVLKGLHSKLMGNPVFQQMFLDEAKLLAQLQHPNIVQVFEVQTCGEVPYMFMEYVHGPTLELLQARAQQRARYEPEHLLQILLQVCWGLDYAHDLRLQGAPAGLVHRDVSSNNILIDAQTGVAKLIDFGIARFDGDRSETQVGLLKGKLPYIAPELLLGARPDRRADVFSVGVLLYRAITQVMPFRGKTMREDVIAGRYPPPSSVTDLPRTLEAIITRALHPDPAQRYQTAAQLAGDLEVELTRMGMEPAQLSDWIQELFPTAGWETPSTPAHLDSALLQQLARAGAEPRRRIHKRWIGLASLVGLTAMGLGLGLGLGLLWLIAPWSA